MEGFKSEQMGWACWLRTRLPLHVSVGLRRMAASSTSKKQHSLVLATATHVCGTGPRCGMLVMGNPADTHADCLPETWGLLPPGQPFLDC